MMYQMPGMLNARCVSLARIGFPEAGCSPLTTKLLLPIISEVCSSNCDRKLRAEFQPSGESASLAACCGALPTENAAAGEVLGTVSETARRCNSGAPTM